MTDNYDIQTKEDLLQELAEKIRQKDGDLEEATEKLEVRSTGCRANQSGMKDKKKNGSC